MKEMQSIFNLPDRIMREVEHKLLER